jgi:hypothetical protein
MCLSRWVQSACIAMIILLALLRGVQVLVEVYDYAANYDAGRLLDAPHEEWVGACAISAGYKSR